MHSTDKRNTRDFLNTTHNYTFSHAEGNLMIQFPSLCLKTITWKEREENTKEKENVKKKNLITGLGIPSNPENSRLRLESWITPRSIALKLTRVQGKQFLWGQSSVISMRPSPAGWKSFCPTLCMDSKYPNKQINSQEPKLTYGSKRQDHSTPKYHIYWRNNSAS